MTDAGTMSCMKDIRIIDKPTAAAAEYGLDEKGAGDLDILVYDTGDDTFDVSPLTTEDGLF